MRRLALSAVVFLAAGCGGDSAREGTAPALPPAPPELPDVGDLDDLDFESGPDSLEVISDTASADTLASGDAAPAPVAPSFEPFLREFKVAIQDNRVRPLTDGLSPDDLSAVAEDPAFRQQVLAAGPDRYRRYGTRREAYLVVGYDAEGNVVPEDEAITESALGLVFDVVDGAYRLVRIERAG